MITTVSLPQALHLLWRFLPKVLPRLPSKWLEKFEVNFALDGRIGLTSHGEE
jgi:hypothetical protein